MKRAVVIGSDRLGLRVAQRLERDGAEFAVVALPGSWLAEARLPPAWRVWRARPDAELLAEEADLARADLLLAVTDVDEVNLGAALAAREVAPGVGLVLRQFNTRLAPILERHLPAAEILSLSALAAPTFALSALSPGVLFAVALEDGEALVLRESEGPGAGAVVAAATEDGLRLLQRGQPRPDGARLLLLASRADQLPLHPRPGGAAPAEERVLAEDPDRRLLGWLLATLALLLGATAALFSWRLGLSALDALYFVSTILTTVGFGDYNLKDADALSKGVGILAMFAGLFLTALLVGLLASRLVARRESRRRGHFRHRLQGHVVICGLGTLGLRVAEDLRRGGHAVVAIDPAPRSRLAALARAAGVAVIEGDGTEQRSLLFASLARARALVVATARDHLNLEIALEARSLAPEIPVTLRIFDADLARRVRRTFGVQAAFSSAALTAGRFASTAGPGTRLAAFTFAESGLELHAVPGPGRVAALAEARRGVAVAVWSAARGLLLEPAPEALVEPGEKLLLVRADS